MRPIARIAVSVLPFACGGSIHVAADAGDATTDDSPSDVASTPDAMPEEDAPDEATYHDLGDPQYWSLMDLTSLVMPKPGFQFLHGCFDGRYVYWSAQNGSAPEILVRYDTQASFLDLSSWSTWTLEPYESGGTMFFDGRFVYVGEDYTFAIRFDTQGTFGDRSSLSLSTPLFGNSGIPPNLGSIHNAASDGRFIFFQGSLQTQSYDSVVVRYDSQGSFNNRASWSAFDPKIGSGVYSLFPAIIAPPYLVRTPTFPPNSSAMIYDMRFPFTDPASWSKFPLQGVTGDEAYSGVGTDGRYAYFVPYRNAQGTSDGLVARYDTTAPFGNASSYDTFQLTKVNPFAKGFHNASWDGRYFYFMVGSDSMMFPTKGNIVVRYDTTATFQNASSWSAYDFTPLVSAKQPIYWSAPVVFDGEYIYLASGYTPAILRFDARLPRKLPPGFSGSFY